MQFQSLILISLISAQNIQTQMEEKVKSQTSTNYFFRQNHQHQRRTSANLKSHINLQHQTILKNNQKIASLMIKVSLSEQFDIRQFKIISSLTPDQWIASQRQLLKKICSNKKVHEKHFPFFYKNHITLLNWFRLGVKQKSTIQPYVFKQFLQQKKTEYCLQQNFNNERLKQSFYRKKSSQNIGNLIQSPTRKEKIQKKFQTLQSNQAGELNDSGQFIQSENISYMKPSFPIGLRKGDKRNKSQTHSLTKQKQELMGVYFNNLIEMNTLEHKRKPLNLKLYKLKKKQDIDLHDLYMKTFDACNGRRYIFYDYEKHMKGLRERNKYNQFLRGNSAGVSIENSCNFEETDAMQKNSFRKMKKYLEYEEERVFQSYKQKCSLLPINMVLNQKELNNSKGLKKVISQNKSSKIVFVNHQGKPITYYIKQQQKQHHRSKLCENRLNKGNKAKENEKKQVNISNSMSMR